MPFFAKIIGFWVTQVREARQNRELAARALNGLEAEWDTAVSTGSLRLLDYDLVSALCEIYQMQDMFRANMDKVGVSSSDWFDPGARDAAVRKLYVAMVELQYDECQLLLPLYRKNLPLISSAIGHR